MGSRERYARTNSETLTSVAAEGIEVLAGPSDHHIRDILPCPGCIEADAWIEDNGDPLWRVEARPWPDGFPSLARPFRVMREGVQVGVYGRAQAAMDAIPVGEIVHQVTIEKHSRIVRKGSSDD